MPRGHIQTTRNAARARAAANRASLPFNHKLVLNQWLLSLFGVDSFDKLTSHLKDESLEGLDSDNIHRFYRALCLHVPENSRPELKDDVLLTYDQNIVSITQHLNQHRTLYGEKPITWKYFQYLALLFTEIYLDRYFHNPEGLRKSLNVHIAAFNKKCGVDDQIALLSEYDDPHLQLNKVAFWMATGSGKTLLMHANILQYQKFLEMHGRSRHLNRIILLTPNEGLSHQHLREFEKSGINAEIFNKDGRGLFTSNSVQILEITKLKDETGVKTVAVDAFGGNNLVLVDEGHRGASSGNGGTWMKYRNALCEKGFSFEYSATFGQAVAGNQELTNLYARSILFDYSYRWFYEDGYGKDYHILNLEKNPNDEWMRTYLIACLLAFYQQLRLYREKESVLRPFNIEKPLWVFVGGSVNAVRKEKNQSVSDVVFILKFLADYVKQRKDSIERIRRVLDEGLQTASGENLFAGRFDYLKSCNLTAEQIFDDSLDTLFNAPAGGLLHVENLKGVVGEIGLRVGDNPYFGVINVGDDADLIKLCDKSRLPVDEKEFADSLFKVLNEKHSSINVLIGSKKFTEGWNSWRVSTLGLMNIGKNEGAQIIQLFGRGVRLKGHGMSLKRSTRTSLPPGLQRPPYIDLLETINIFGIHANYMAQFRDFLKAEGLDNNNKRIEFVLPVIRNLGTKPLKMIRVKKEVNGVKIDSVDAFRKLGPAITLEPPCPDQELATNYLQNNKVVLNWYPKIRAMKSEGLSSGASGVIVNEAHLTEQHVAFLDIDNLYFDLLRFKAERGWHNLNITRAGIAALLSDTSWYQLLILKSELAFDSFAKVSVWQEIARVLLRKYAEHYYKFRRSEWELPRLEYCDLTADDPNLSFNVDENSQTPGYRIMIEESQQEIIEELKKLKQAIEQGRLKNLKLRGLKAIWFGQHLFQPLLFLGDDGVTKLEISPVALNKGEAQFVEDLKTFYDNNQATFIGRELYLIRNLSKGRGIGFFEANNFHPDFIVWLLEGDWQRIIFVDPKGLRYVSLNDPKINFYQTIKNIENRLRCSNTNVTLESFIISNTSSQEIYNIWKITKSEMQKKHILFQEEDQSSYIREMLMLPHDT